MYLSIYLYISNSWRANNKQKERDIYEGDPIRNSIRQDFLCPISNSYIPPIAYLISSLSPLSQEDTTHIWIFDSCSIRSKPDSQANIQQQFEVKLSFLFCLYRISGLNTVKVIFAFFKKRKKRHQLLLSLKTRFQQKIFDLKSSLLKQTFQVSNIYKSNCIPIYEKIKKDYTFLCFM